MRLFLLSQKEYNIDAVNTILVRAENEEEARVLASMNEHEERDNAQKWTVDFTDCKELTVDGKPKVILVS